MAQRDPSFGHIVKERRRALELTQTEVARRVACATVTIRRIEYDTLRPSQQIAERLARALNVPLPDRARFVQLARAAGLADHSPPPLPTPTPTPEEIGRADLSGRAIRGYELGERIGTGGFGVVYCAVQPLVEREVAIKIVLPQYADHPDFIRRFEAEAQLVARLEHPYIVPLYDYWREPGVAYLVMRLLRGGSLEDRVRAGPLALETVAVLLEQIGAALHAAHRAGVVHRDLKPSNVLLDEDGNAYLADFGIAKNLNVAEQTQVGTIVASPAYASPEQIRSQTVLPQADIYGLGVLLYELLAGEKPFPGPTPIDYIQQHFSAPLPALVAHPELDPLLRRATAKDPAARYPDVPSLLADFRRVLAGRPLPTVPYALAGAGELENPYKGLRAFTEADADDFFGRETFVQELLGSLSAADDPEGEGVPRELGRFLAVVGPSGCGKSSAVKAGLIPALRRGALPGSDQWFIVDMQPGAHPFEELEAALLRIAASPSESLLAQLEEGERGFLRALRRVLPADPAVELVLVIDQFEELFTQVADAEERAAFIGALVTAVVDPESRVRVVVTLRADFTDRPLQYVELGELVRQRAVFVLPLTAEELEEAIARPAARVGLALEEGLVARIVQDVGAEPGVLPLLQYALTELWERREGRVLMLTAYRESGGVSGALARRAEELYGGLGEEEREAVRQLFLRLVTLGEGTEDTRRRVLQAEVEGVLALTPTPLPPSPSPENRERGRGVPAAAFDRTRGGRGEGVRAVLDAFGRHRLLTFDRDPLTRGPTVEVAHEALLREWGRLRNWLEESRADVRLQRLLAAAAGEWEGAGREPSYLLTGARLAQFAGWAEGSRIALTGGEHAFLAASVVARESAETAEQGRRERELQTALQLAKTEKERAEEQRKRAEAEQLRAEEQEKRAEAEQQRAEEQQKRAEERDRAARRLRQRAFWLAGALAVAAVLAALALFFGQASNNSFQEAGRNLNAAQTAQAQAVAEAGMRATAQAAAMAEADVRATAQAVAVTQQAIAEDEARARATAEAEALASLNHSEALRLAGEANQILLKGGDPELAALLALKSLRLEYTPQGDEALEGAARLDYPMRIITSDALAGLAWSPDGRYIAGGGVAGPIYLWDAASGQERGQFAGHTAAVGFLVFSPDSRYLVSSSHDLTVRLWEVETGRQIHQIGPEPVALVGVFSPDGRYLLTGGDGENAVRLWDVATGAQVRAFAGLTGTTYAVAFSPDGRTVAAGSLYDRGVWLWDATTGQVQASFLSAEAGILDGLAFFPDGQTLLTVFFEGSVRLWDVPTLLATGGAGATERQRLDSEGGISGDAFAISPDGRFLLVNTGYGVTQVWEVASGTLRRFHDPAQIFGGAFSPDSRIVATANDDGVRLWELAPQRGLPRFSAQASLNDVVFSPDGRIIATASNGAPTARLWDAQTGAALGVLTHTVPVYGVVFSPDGQTVATGAYDSNAHLWDVRTGQELRQFTGHTSPNVFTVAFSPDGRLLASISTDATARLWDVSTGEQRLMIEMPAYGDTLAISPRGDTLLTGSNGGKAYLWDVATGLLLHELVVGEEGYVGARGYSPDGRYVVIGSPDGPLTMWDVRTGAEVRRFLGHSAAISFAIFSPDGRFILSCGADQTARLWDVGTGRELRCFAGHTDFVAGVAFSPDGQVVATAGWDGTFRLWYADLNDTIADLCGRLLRDLTAEEREQYGVGEGETCPLVMGAR